MTTSEPDLRVHWKLRPDIQVYPHDDLSAVLKDPLTGSYMLLVEHEFMAVKILETSTYLSEWHERLLRAFPGSGVTRDDLKAFLLRLCRHQVLQSALTGRLMPASEEGSASPLKVFRTLLGACFRIRIPITHPTVFAESLARRLWFAFTPAAVALGVFTFLLALAVVMVRFAEFRREIPAISTLLSLANLPWLLVMFVFVKLLHEIGHIVTCAKLGARVRDCGFLLLFFTPVLYTNVSDSWILPRRSRMLISAAGILVELFLAAVFTILWWMAPEGQARYVLMNGILLCSVSTLAFNGNPLLRFDGYFVLADLIRVPNLYQRSVMETQLFFRNLWQHSIRHAAAGISDRRFLIYGILVCLYRILLCLGLCSIAGVAMHGAGLSPLDLPVRLLLLTALAVLPVVGFVRFVLLDAARTGTWLRTLFRTGIFAGIFWLLMLIPLPGTVTVPCVFIPEGVPIYAELSGRLISAADYGDRIKEGTEIVRLENDELMDQIVSAEADLREKKLRLENLRRLGVDQSSELLPTALESSVAAERQVVLLRRQAEQLRILSPRTAFLQPPEPVMPKSAGHELSKWHGTPLAPENAGATIERGTLLGYAGRSDAVRAVAVLSDNQVENLRVGGEAIVMILSGRRDALPTTVSDLTSEDIRALPECLLALPENQTMAAERLKSERPVYAVSCHLISQDPAELPVLYSSGVVKIKVQPVTLGIRVQRFLRTTIFRAWL